MQVVDTVEVHVLGVPGKRGLPHAEVQVRCVDAFDGDATLTFDGVQNGVQMANVPLLDVLKPTEETGVSPQKASTCITT